MEVDDIRSLPDDEIVSEMGKAREKIFKLKFQAKGTSVENSGSLKNLKRDVARMLTILHERKLNKATGK